MMTLDNNLTESNLAKKVRERKRNCNHQQPHAINVKWNENISRLNIINFILVNY